MYEFLQGGWATDVHAFLHSVIPSMRGIAAFDFDNTLIKNDFGEAVMNELVAEGLPRQKDHLLEHFYDEEKARSFLGSTNLKNNLLFSRFFGTEYEIRIQTEGYESAYRWTSFVFAGYSKSELKEIALRVWNKHVRLPHSDKHKITPYSDMVRLIQFMKEHKWDIYIVTASPTLIIRPVAEVFGISQDNVIGMELETKNQQTTKNILEPYTYGQGKLKAFYNRVGRYMHLAFGDSFNDYPMLKRAGLKGILIDKGQEELLSKCKNYGCLIQPVFKV
jgi:HAD superfamily phosphoserine phosphatase-like hydrolase